MGSILTAYNALPRWLTVLFWIACSSVVSALITDVQTGVFTISNPIYIPIVNVLLVAAKDFINTQMAKGS